MKNKFFSIFSPALIVMLFTAFSLNAQTVNNHKNKMSEPLITQVKHPVWSIKANIYEVNIRQYTPQGTFKAFETNLPRLEKMGVKILWLMPVFPIGEKNRKGGEGSLGSYYSIKNYEEVNPHFGTLQDLKDLVNDAHKRGMHVILDWVANHTAWDNVWATEHPDWYDHNNEGGFVSPYDWTDVIQLNYKNMALRKAMINAMKYWVKNADVDGFRCDVAGMVPVDFWDEARKELDEIKPVFMLAEDEDNTALMKHAFDMNYTWNMLHLDNDIAQGKKHASDLWGYMNWENETYGPNVYRMYFTSNHDENSWNGTAFDRLGKGFKAFTVLDYTIPGFPLIYGGEEAGSNKALRFFKKDTIDWSHKTYEDFYTTLNKFKADNQALWNGSEGGTLVPLSKGVSQSVFAFYREKDGNQVVVILNLSPASQEFKLENEVIHGKYNELFTDEKIQIHSDWNIKLEPWHYVVLYK
ncbi:MAG: alpha-glucosidase C-terminal domain-containing protein [Bacteroidales bacterium]|nr:alpha-glucosidase C-terminal domain-containing protein [Bacteroidales bacterium]